MYLHMYNHLDNQSDYCWEITFQMMLFSMCELISIFPNFLERMYTTYLTTQRFLFLWWWWLLKWLRPQPQPGLKLGAWGPKSNPQPLVPFNTPAPWSHVPRPHRTVWQSHQGQPGAETRWPEYPPFWRVWWHPRWSGRGGQWHCSWRCRWGWHGLCSPAWSGAGLDTNSSRARGDTGLSCRNQDSSLELPSINVLHCHPPQLFWPWWGPFKFVLL